MTIIVTVFRTARLTVSEKKTKTLLLQTPDQASLTPPLVIEAAGQRYRQKTQFLYLGGVMHESADLPRETDRRTRLMRACHKRFAPKLYDMAIAPALPDSPHAEGRGD